MTNLSSVPMFSQATIDRFWSYVDKTSDPDGHWLWTAGLHKGYGRFWYKDAAGKPHNISAHRFALILRIGPLPTGIYALHEPPCTTTHCVRHVYAGTNYQNSQDMVALGRAARGIDNGNATLTEEEIVAIHRIGHTIPTKSLAEQFHVSETTIRLIKDGFTWKHIPRDPIPRIGRRHRAKLTDQQARDIRASHTGAYGEVLALARQYNVTRNTIWNVLTYKCYKDI